MNFKSIAIVCVLLMANNLFAGKKEKKDFRQNQITQLKQMAKNNDSTIEVLRNVCFNEASIISICLITYILFHVCCPSNLISETNVELPQDSFDSFAVIFANLYDRGQINPEYVLKVLESTYSERKI